jgi:hypothetical protein
VAKKKSFKSCAARQREAQKKSEAVTRPLPAPASWREHSIALGVVAVLVFAMFGDLLLTGGTQVFGNQHTDLYLQFVSWRQFGFSELAKGNLVLWNPYVFAGEPYFGGAQAALLYPVNFLSLIMPLAAAINWSIALNAFLFGAFMYAWMIFRGLRPVSGLFAAMITIFCGAHFMHVYSGHTVHMATMAWGPVIFLAIDGIFEKRKLTWSLVGMFAVAMQAFAGNPQYLFYTAIAAGLYSLCRMAFGAKLSIGLLAGLAGIYLGGVLLSAIQLLVAMQASGETVRSEPLPYFFAKMFSLPPENLATLIAPNFFGDMLHQAYWGRCYLWEMSLYVGVVGFVLAVYGALFGQNRKGIHVALVMIGILLVLALGDHTPLFSLLYYHVPGFDKFRCMAKFIYPASLFIILLAAHGFDRLLIRRAIEPKFLISIFVFGGVLVVFALWVRNADWRPVIQGIQAAGHGDTYLPPAVYNTDTFISGAQAFASNTVFIAAATCLVLGGLLASLCRSQHLIYAVLALSVAEMFAVARNSRDTFDSNTVVNPEIKEFLEDHPGDYRIFNPLNHNSGMSLGAQDIWGYDPGVVRRYAEFATWTQGGDPDQATLYVQFKSFDPLYAMLRLRYAFLPDKDQMRIAEAPTAPLPRVLLVPKYRVIKKRDQIFHAMRETGFDPRTEVLLERPPIPAPVESDNPGTVKVTISSTDYLDIEADVAQPAILLVTDLYTPAWRTVTLPGSTQQQYELQPANYILRAVPLAAGHHHLRIEYAPRVYAAGKWISIFSWLAFAGTAGIAVLISRSRKPAVNES